MTNKLRWQVPGNANPFDSKLENWKDKNYLITQRSIGVLNYLKHKSMVSKKNYEEEIRNFIKKIIMGKKIN